MDAENLGHPQYGRLLTEEDAFQALMYFISNSLKPGVHLSVHPSVRPFVCSSARITFGPEGPFTEGPLALRRS